MGEPIPEGEAPKTKPKTEKRICAECGKVMTEKALAGHLVAKHNYILLAPPPKTIGGVMATGNVWIDDAFKRGHEVGYREGYDVGRIEGYQKGYREGKHDGYVEGYENGYEAGYSDRQYDKSDFED